MDYWIKTSNGAMRNDRGVIVYFSNHTDARHYAINYCDQSDPHLEIRNKRQDLINVLEVQS
jgi:hypothetical protein